MTRRKKLLLAWIVLNAVILTSALILYDEGPNRDVDLLLYIAMGLLSFPSSVLAGAITAACLAGLHALTGAVLNVSAARSFLYGACCL